MLRAWYVNFHKTWLWILRAFASIASQSFEYRLIVGRRSHCEASGFLLRCLLSTPNWNGKKNCRYFHYSGLRFECSRFMIDWSDKQRNGVAAASPWPLCSRDGTCDKSDASTRHGSDSISGIVLSQRVWSATKCVRISLGKENRWTADKRTTLPLLSAIKSFWWYRIQGTFIRPIKTRNNKRFFSI